MTAASKPRPRPAATRSSGRSSAKYAPPSVTMTLLKDSLAARNSRLAADDMVSPDDAAELAQTTRVTINTWIDKGRCIGPCWHCTAFAGMTIGGIAARCSRPGWPTWRALSTAAGFEELTHFYRPAGLPREQQPWLASVWRRR